MLPIFIYGVGGFALLLLFLYCLYLLTKGNDSGVFKGSFVSDFKPLTHIEIEQEKPLIIKMSDKWYFVANLNTTEYLIRFFESKESIMKLINENNDLTSGFILLRELLWDICEKPRGLIKRFQFKKFFYSYFLNNVETFFLVFNTLMEYETRLFFLLKSLLNFEMVQTMDYFVMAGGVSSQELKGTPIHTSNIFLK